MTKFKNGQRVRVVNAGLDRMYAGAEGVIKNYGGPKDVYIRIVVPEPTGIEVRDCDGDCTLLIVPDSLEVIDEMAE